jgi:hypothetical protein
MMHAIHKILIALTILITPVMAAANTTSSNGLTASGPFNILVSLGLEYIVPIDWAYLIYNFIAIGLLYFAMSMASQRNMRFFTVIVPMLGGMFAYFGWYNNYNSTIPVIPMVIATGVIGYGIYLKDTNREKWGAGGGGSTLINFVFYIILLQACVGLVNSSNIWSNNAAPTPNQYQNVDLGQQIGGISNQGGLLSGGISTLIMLGLLAIQALIMIISIIATIAAFSLVVVWTFPFLLASPWTILILGVVQVVVWLLYVWFYFIMIYKPPVLDQIGVG